MSETNSRKRQPKSQRRSTRQASARKRARQRTLLIWAGGAIGLAVILILGLVFITGDDDGEPETNPAESVALYQDIQSDGRFLGDPEAPVEFVIYSDFQCPVCKRFDTQDFPAVIDNFVKTGDVRVEWRPMPIISGFEDIPLEDPDNESVQAAEAAMCAADQDQFWPYSEALFTAQGAENSSTYTDEMLKQTALDLELDTEAFNTCLDSGEKQRKVLDLRQDGLDRGVKGTPTFLINDQLVSYTREGFDRLEQQFNDALDGKLVEK